MKEHYSLYKLQSQYDSLLQEILVLKDQVARLTALRDDLLYHICPSLQAEYEEKIACLERELLAAQLYLREKQRIIEILQAQMNQNREPSFKEAEKSAYEEYKEYQEDLKRKARDAQDFKDRWHNESKWYEYDDGYRNRQEEDEDKHTGNPDQDPGEDKTQSEKEESRKQDDEQTEGEPTKKESKGSELKRLYRKIVKLLHPDVHPDPTPKEKELLNKAIEAYNRGDLETIKKIWDELTGSGMATEEEIFEDTPEGIAKMKETLERLRKRYMELKEEILHIRSSYPYTMKAFLEDEKAVEARQEELHSEIDRTREMDRQLEEYINQLKKQMGNV